MKYICSYCRGEQLPCPDFNGYKVFACVNPDCSHFGCEYFLTSGEFFVVVNRDFEGMTGKESVHATIKRLGFGIDKNIDLSVLVLESFEKFPEQMKTHRTGKKDLSGFFVGQIIKLNKNLDPKSLREEILKQLSDQGV